MSCECGETRGVPGNEECDWALAEELALAALGRASLRVHAVPVGAPNSRAYTLRPEATVSDSAALTQAEATRYAEAVNSEAELARIVMRLVARRGLECASGTMRIAVGGDED